MIRCRNGVILDHREPWPSDKTLEDKFFSMDMEFLRDVFSDLRNVYIVDSAIHITDGELHLQVYPGGNVMIFRPDLYHAMEQRGLLFRMLKDCFIEIHAEVPKSFKYKQEEVEIRIPHVYGEGLSLISIGTWWSELSELPYSWNDWVHSEVMLASNEYKNLVIKPRGHMLVYNIATKDNNYNSGWHHIE
jgi:hypothetical protein